MADSRTEARNIQDIQDEPRASVVPKSKEMLHTHTHRVVSKGHRNQ